MRHTPRTAAACLSALAALAVACPALGADAAPATPDDSGPALAVPPELKHLVAADLPPDTPFPAPVVKVLLELEVATDGQVAAARVLAGPGAPFDDAALVAARGFRFSPARLTTGEAVPVTVTFELRIAAPPPPPPQPVVYVGTLLARGTRRPLAGVSVVARADGAVLAEALTDAGGRFTLTVPAPAFRLVAVPLGHDRLDLPITAVPGERVEARLFLEAEAGHNVTVVRAGRVLHEVTKRVVPKEAVESAVGTAGDTLKVIQNLPGVARATFGSGDLILRGSSPEDSKIMLDGLLIPLAYHFGGLRSAFNSAFLEQIDFLPGNFGPDYGDATGGVVDIKTRDPASDLFRGEVDINAYDAGFVLEGPVAQGLSIGGAFHRSWIDTVLPLFIPDDTPLTFDTLPRYYDYQLIASYAPSAEHRLKLVGFGSNDQLRLVLDRPLADDPGLRGALDNSTMFHSLILSHDWKISPRLRHRVSLGYLYGDSHVGVGSVAYVDNSWHALALRAEWTWAATDGLDLRLGFDETSAAWQVALLVPNPPKEGNPPGSFSSMESLRVDAADTSHTPAAYLEVALRPTPALTLLPSVRAGYFPDIASWVVDPRFSARWELSPETRLAAGVGLYQQQPSGDESLAGFGTPQLRPERALHTSAGFTRSFFGERLSVELTGFYKHLDRLVTPNPDAPWVPDAPRYLSAGTGRIYGAELLIKANVPGLFDGWLAYTLQRSLRVDGPGRSERPFDWDQPHILAALGRLQLGAGWSASLRFRLVSGNPYTPVSGSVYDAKSDTYLPLYGAVNSRRMSPFHQLDLRVDKTFTFETWKLTAYVEVQNAYYHANQEGVDWSYDFSTSSASTGLPILPILGVKGEW